MKKVTKAGKFWILAAVLGLLGLVEAVTGFVLWIGYPESGSGAGKLYGGIGNIEVLGLAKHTWIDIHDWVAVALTLMVVLHIIVHWKWILRVARNIIDTRQTAPVKVVSQR
ncbi:MAG: DUF4405 domain-containing protein [Dehalococcoidales bacterium]|nr:DUF4405 domain-containing protein [Dehalococcoidales bacterium]